MFSPMGLEIWIKWTSNYLDAQSPDETPLARKLQRLHKAPLTTPATVEPRHSVTKRESVNLNSRGGKKKETYLKM